MVSVLVVDDDKDLLRVVKKLLEACGYSVVTCADAHEALDRLRQETFDLILSDANMPAVSGFELVKTIRSHEAGEHVVIALLTGRRDKKDVQYALDCGADDYICKPIDPDLFMAKVESLLKKKPPIPYAEIAFVESPVNMSAKWEVSTEITHLSEQGLTLKSPIAAVSNAKIKVASALFDAIGIPAPALRVLRCFPDETQGHIFFTKVSFIGLTEAERQKIRFWINSNISAYKNVRAA